MLPLMLAGYLFLLIFRPYEYWPILGDFRIERIYMLVFMAAVFLARDKRLVPSPINGSVALFSLAMLVSAAFAYDWEVAWFHTADYLKYVVFYFMAVLSVRNEKDFRLVLFAFMGVMLLYVGKSAWEFFLHDRFIYRMGIKRMVGIDSTYGDPNSFAASICYSLPLAWAMIRSKFESPWVRRSLWAYSAIALVAIMFTGSRSGMVTFVLFLFLLVMGSSRKVLGIVLAGVLLLVSWDYMPDDLKNRFMSTFSSEYADSGAAVSAQGRTVGFKQGLSLFRANPLLGVGPSNFPLSWPGLVKGPNAHNLYGQLAGELGLAGLTTFGLLLWLVYRANARIVSDWRRMRDDAAPGDAGGAKVAGGAGGPPGSPGSPPVRNSMGPAPGGGLLSVASTPAFHAFVAQAIIQTMILMLFKGWADHNLYRYTWLWLAALTVLGHHYYFEGAGRRERA